MNKRINRLRVGYLMVIALCMVAMLAGTALAQGRMGRMGQGQPQDLLMPLKNALENAGAVALSSDQETRISTLIANFRAANPPTTPSADFQAARLKYDDAILASQTAVASAQIPILVATQTSQAGTRLLADTAFAIAVVQALTADQVGALAKRMGSGGVVRLIESLAGGPGGMGRGMGMGPAGFGRGSGNPIKK
jgi:hypothetical protein